MSFSVTLPGWKYREPQRLVLDRAIGPGTLLGGTYRLIKRIGGGGMGSIYLASHARLPGQWTVKILHPSDATPAGLAQFRHEATVLARIRHPNIVQIVDFNWTEHGLPFLVMEHLPGKDLAGVLKAQPHIGAEQVRSILGQIAAALYAAHSSGVVHRDLTPRNIMVVPCEGRADVVKLIDFGVSERLGTAKDGNRRGAIAGTPEFMSPEQAEGQRDVDYSSDVFSLAVVAYLLLTGRTPWQGSTAEQVLASVIRCEPEPIGGQDKPWAVESVLLRGMAKVRGNRYPSTIAFVRALERAMVNDGMLPEVGPLMRKGYVGKRQAEARLFSVPRVDESEEAEEQMVERRISTDLRLVEEPAKWESATETPKISVRSMRLRYGLRVSIALILGLGIGSGLGLMDFGKVAAGASMAWDNGPVRSVRNWGSRKVAPRLQEGRDWIERAYLTAGRAKQNR